LKLTTVELSPLTPCSNNPFEQRNVKGQPFGQEKEE